MVICKTSMVCRYFFPNGLSILDPDQGSSDRMEKLSIILNDPPEPEDIQHLTRKWLKDRACSLHLVTGKHSFSSLSGLSDHLNTGLHSLDLRRQIMHYLSTVSMLSITNSIIVLLKCDTTYLSLHVHLKHSILQLSL